MRTYWYVGSASPEYIVRAAGFACLRGWCRRPLENSDMSGQNRCAFGFLTLFLVPGPGLTLLVMPIFSIGKCKYLVTQVCLANMAVQQTALRLRDVPPFGCGSHTIHDESVAVQGFLREAGREVSFYHSTTWCSVGRLGGVVEAQQPMKLLGSRLYFPGCACQGTALDSICTALCRNDV